MMVKSLLKFDKKNGRQKYFTQRIPQHPDIAASHLNASLFGQSDRIW